MSTTSTTHVADDMAVIYDVFVRIDGGMHGCVQYMRQ